MTIMSSTVHEFEIVRPAARVVGRSVESPRHQTRIRDIAIKVLLDLFSQNAWTVDRRAFVQAAGAATLSGDLSHELATS